MRRVSLGLVGCLWGRDRGGCWWQIVWWGLGIHPHPGPTRRGVRSRGEGRRRRNEARRGRRRRGAVGVGGDGVVVGGYLGCEEAECEGDKQEEAEKCGGEGEAGEMGDGVADWCYHSVHKHLRGSRLKKKKKFYLCSDFDGIFFIRSKI